MPLVSVVVMVVVVVVVVMQRGPSGFELVRNGDEEIGGLVIERMATVDREGTRGEGDGVLHTTATRTERQMTNKTSRKGLAGLISEQNEDGMMCGETEETQNHTDRQRHQFQPGRSVPHQAAS